MIEIEKQNINHIVSIFFLYAVIPIALSMFINVNFFYRTCSDNVSLVICSSLLRYMYKCKNWLNAFTVKNK